MVRQRGNYQSSTTHDYSCAKGNLSQTEMVAGWLVGELSCRNELCIAFLDRFQWLKAFHENILQSGQHFCCSFLSELLQSARDAWRKFLG